MYQHGTDIYLHLMIQQKLLISGKEMLMSAELKGCVTRFIHFHNIAKFYHCRVCVTDLRCNRFKGGSLLATALPHSLAAPKRPILNRSNIIQ